MIRKISVTLALIAALALALSSACALQITYAGTSPVLNGTNPGDGLPRAIDSTIVHLLGVNDDGSYLVYAGGSFLNVPADQLSTTFAQMAPGLELPYVSELTTFTRGMRNDAVTQLQENLRQLGLMTGRVDGEYGAQSEAGVRAFQLLMGLPEDGAATPAVQLLLRSACAEGLVLEGVASVRAVFDAIEGRTDVSLDPMYNAGLTLDYDDMTGEGFISDGTACGIDASGLTDIDRRSFQLRFGFEVSEDEAGKVTLTPAIRIECACVRRPMMQGLLMKSGARRVSAEVTGVTSRVDGARSVEYGLVPLDADALALLADAENAGELKLRVTGKYEDFDMELPAEAIASAAKVGMVAGQLQ